MLLRSLALGLLLATLAAGCADRTAILVEVTSSDYAIPSEIDSLSIRATSTFGSMFERTYPVGVSWPHSLTITPAPQEGIGWVDIEVTGNLAGVPVVTRMVRSEFIPGETRRVSVVLTRCTGAECPGFDGGVPDGGMSDVPELDGGSDAGLDGGGLDAGFDAGRDAGADGGMDAGMDAGSDSGVDAPTDAGRDAPLPPGARLVINEVDYDQDSTDTAEFVEIYNAGSVSAPLGTVAVVLYDGSGGTEYARAMLSGTLAPGAYLVVGIAGQTLTLPGGVTRVDFTGAMATAIQNGPDGVALLDTGAMTILDRFSYESPAVTNAVIFGTPTTLVEGTAFTTADSTTARTLCRRPNGTDTDNAATDFMTCTPASPGAANP